MHIFESKMNSLRTIILTWNWTFSIRTCHFWSKLSSKHFLWWKMFLWKSFFGENDRLDTDPKMDFLDRNDLAVVWNRFEHVRTKILTFKFELKSHFIIIQNLKMLKYLQLRRLEFARSGSLFFYQNNKIYQNSDIKNWSSKVREISISKISKITILGFDSSANQVQYCSLGWNNRGEWGWNQGETQINEGESRI